MSLIIISTIFFFISVMKPFSVQIPRNVYTTYMTPLNIKQTKLGEQN